MVSLKCHGPFTWGPRTLSELETYTNNRGEQEEAKVLNDK